MAKLEKRKLSSQSPQRSSRRSVLLLLGTYNVDAHAGIARFASEHGWHLNADMARIPVIPRGWTGDGIITGLGEWEDPVRFVLAQEQARTPIVDIYQMRPDIALPRVAGDHALVGKQAAEHFLEGSWRHFGWFARANHHVATLRREGFERALADRGYTSRWIGRDLRFSLKGYSSDKLLAAVGAELLAGPKPEAVFAFNDFDAAFLMDACHRVGLTVPDDVAILGVDNNPLVVNAVQPRLSSVKLDFQRIGYEAASLLHRLMDGSSPPTESLLIAPRGVAGRESTDTTAVHHPVVRKTLSTMKVRLRESLGVEDLARAAGCSRRTLETLFQKELRRSVHRTLLEIRLREARHLLQTTNDTVESIAADTGFCHAPHLYREYKRWTGLTPRAWRKINGSGEPSAIL